MRLADAGSTVHVGFAQHRRIDPTMLALGERGGAIMPDIRTLNLAGPTAPSQSLLSVGFVLADHFTLSAFSLFIDQLRLAADEGDRSRQILCRWVVMTSRPDPVKASCGVTVGRTSHFVDPRNFHYIVVVGGILHAGRQLDEETISYLRAADAAGVTLVGLCTGSFILARAGLMTGRKCCVSWYHYQDFMDEFPHHHPVADQLFVVDGDRITCSGGSSTADLATYLIERHIGRAVAQKSRHVLLLDRARLGSDAQPPPPIAEIAQRLHLSTRQLERLFQTVAGMRPAAFYRSLRLRYARWLLDNTNRLVTDIALDAGFSDCAHFSRQFKAMHGFTPSETRGGRHGEDTPALRAAGPPAKLAGFRVFG